MRKTTQSGLSTPELKPGESILLGPTKRLCKAVFLPSEQQSITPESVERARKATKLLELLLTYAAPAGAELSRAELEAGWDALAKLQSGEYAEETFLKAGEQRRGRPVKRRHVAAVALEAKRRNPSLSSVELAQQFCACGEAHHSKECAERLRRDIQRLNAVIRRILSDYPA